MVDGKVVTICVKRIIVKLIYPDCILLLGCYSLWKTLGRTSVPLSLQHIQNYIENTLKNCQTINTNYVKFCHINQSILQIVSNMNLVLYQVGNFRFFSIPISVTTIVQSYKHINIELYLNTCHAKLQYLNIHSFYALDYE